ncbi:hypothetical protein LTS07_005580 [Exophiala sideris]|uniref:TeaA receptor TeaR n=1 Tax=Exophiala sideris TaxID=1016849 RepID=A0ABR0J8P4_9EURO|nr:hypothetical protein LTS07_005580 [Exophiala sideris]KAK5058383.1 hypothetical protein LTR69_006788 [Exophiala sideris]
MAGVASAGTATTVINSSGIGYAVAGSSSQENPISSKRRPNEPRQNLTSSGRAPLSSVAPNRKDTNGTGRVAHSRVEELGQPERQQLVRSDSEADSLLDLYKGEDNGRNTSEQPKDNDNDIPDNMYRPDRNDPGWIHRDKLAKIESEELQAAGINLANARRNPNKSTERDTNGGQQREERSPPDTRRSEPGEGGQNVVEEDERSNWDLRTPEEIAADPIPPQTYSYPVVRKIGSKIPVLTSSPLPISPERIERDTPLPRKRAVSGSMSPEEGLPVLKTRMRKGSTGSAQLLDDSDSPGFTHDARLPSLKQPLSIKTTPKTAPSSPPGTSAGRKASGTASMRKSSTTTKAVATPSPSQRPGTRSGELDRPRTAINRPEGDPPWLATMYKPDPMLPPDQQIIPTHARRQQQAQWEDSGAIPTTYDRNFSPLAIHTGNGVVKGASPVLPSPSSPVQDGDKDNTSWPLRPVPSARNSANGRPGTSGSTNGGYSTMPRVTSPAIIQSPRMGNISSTPTQPSSTQVRRLQHNDMDEKVKDKSCGCCIVM